MSKDECGLWRLEAEIAGAVADDAGFGSHLAFEDPCDHESRHRGVLVGKGRVRRCTLHEQLSAEDGVGGGERSFVAQGPAAARRSRVGYGEWKPDGQSERSADQRTTHRG